MEWPTDRESAKRLQKELSTRVRIEPLKKNLRYIAGADASYCDDRIIGVVSLFSYQDMELIEEVWCIDKIRFPYIPGLLSFREGPVIVKTLKVLSVKPDLILFDGQGICHPEGLGIASHMGIITETPTIGCAKSLLTGTYKEPGLKKGDWSYIYINEMVKGMVLRTRDHTRPVFVSPGHLIDFKDSLRIVLNCCKTYRIPEPLRRADITSKIIKKKLSTNG